MENEEKLLFDKLTVNREGLTKALESPALSGVKRTVVDKYSDQAHFIFELLQNADDARATSARFELFGDKLIFAHNGKRRFFVTDPDTESQDSKNGALGDINAITSIGNSNKTSEDKIGKFGVGFKAVFQYTDKPHIYDPNVFFKIEDFIVPRLLPKDYDGRQKNETLFVFPFAKAKEAHPAILEKLNELNYSLLFLSNLEEVSFKIFGAHSDGFYKKNVIPAEKLVGKKFDNVIAEFVRLEHNNGGAGVEKVIDGLWLFSRVDGKHRYSVGFFVDNGDPYAAWHLVRSKIRYAFCFFPTKVVTALQFIVQAPFLLTDSREGILVNKHNGEMIEMLSKLAADSFVCLKEIGILKNTRLIDDKIFLDGIVPYDEKDFTPTEATISFMPFFTKIKETFETEAILPSEDGYVAKGKAYWASVPKLAELFSGGRLADLINDKDARWVFTSFGHDETDRRNKPLADYIDFITKTYVRDSTSTASYGGLITYIDRSPTFFEKQPMEWLHSFYEWIADSTSRTDNFKKMKIFLNQDKKAVAAIDIMGQSTLFLPKDGFLDYSTVHEDLLKNEKTTEFIKRLGIHEPDWRSEIEHKIIPNFENRLETDGPESLFKKLFGYYQECPATKVNNFINSIRERKFLFYKSEIDGIRRIDKGEELYFKTESLQKWFKAKSDTQFVSFNKYLELVGKDKKDELEKFLTELGVEHTPRVLHWKLDRKEVIENQWSLPYSTRGPEWTEYFIDGCKELLIEVVKEQDEELSRILWLQLIKVIKRYGERWAHVECKYFYRFDRCDRFASRDLNRLRTLPWLVNNDGAFVSAADLTRQSINEKYNVSNYETNNLFRLLEIHDKIEEDKDKNIVADYAKRLGCTEEEMLLDLEEYVKKKEDEARRKHHESVESAPEKNDTDELNRTPSPGGGCIDIFGVDTDSSTSAVNRSEKSVRNVLKELYERTLSKKHTQTPSNDTDDAPGDEDDYCKPTVDINKKIEKTKEQAEQKINEIRYLETLKQQARDAEKYTYGWFKALLELESMNIGENNANSREISISFAKVEREEGTSRVLILKHPSRYIPQFMEDLANIPLALYFGKELTKNITVEVEVVSVKSYTLRAKLRQGEEQKIDDEDLSQVTDALIITKNPVFLIDALKKAFASLVDGNGDLYNDDFNMQKNLSKDIEFIFGPPGTGKTTYLARNVIIPMMAKAENLRVLVLTPTNKAADVLVRRLMESMGVDRSYINWLIRFGATNDNTIEQSGVFHDKTFDIRSFPCNVTVTTIVRFPYDYFLSEDGNRLHLDALKWDYIIIDEASMVSLTSIIYPLYKKTPQKFIIAGDPFQIEPITTVDIWKNENIYTMVELSEFTEQPRTVPHPYNVTLLTTQYRSIPVIGEVFSRFAYNGVLKHFRSNDSQRQLSIDGLDLRPLNIIKFPVSKYESVYRPKRLQSKSSYQVYSALFVVELVKYLSSNVEPVTDDEKFKIGLIAPYRAQADLIDKLMTTVELPSNIDVQADTIHGFQGDECNIIIANFNPPPRITAHKEAFLNKMNIINVSISRARDYLFIIMPDDNTENVEDLILIKKVERLCKEQSAWSDRQSHNMEEVMFGSGTYLEDNSFSTSHQLVNVYGKPEKRYEIRSEDNAVDVQIHNND